jgi:hypothetical protein|tara:strand:- start:185 stop:304 length:120 start_codon:yes stop_codon:yes gene_type:complete
MERISQNIEKPINIIIAKTKKIIISFKGNFIKYFNDKVF